MSRNIICSWFTHATSIHRNTVHKGFTCIPAVTLSSNRNFVGYLIQARVPVPGQPFNTYRIVGTIESPGPQGSVLYCNSTADSPGAPPLPVRQLDTSLIFVLLYIILYDRIQLHRMVPSRFAEFLLLGELPCLLLLRETFSSSKLAGIMKNDTYA